MFQNHSGLNQIVVALGCRELSFCPCATKFLGSVREGFSQTGYGENLEQSQRELLFECDPIGRLLIKLNRDARQDYAYEDVDRLLSIQRQPNGIGKQLGITEGKLEYAYDLLGRITQEITPKGVLGYECDPLSYRFHP